MARTFFGSSPLRSKAGGYECSWRIDQMADFGVPQSRKRLVFLAGRGFLIALPTQATSNLRNREESCGPGERCETPLNT